MIKLHAQALVVMVLAGLDCQHYAAHGTAAFAQASNATSKLLEDLIWYCDDVVVLSSSFLLVLDFPA